MQWREESIVLSVKLFSENYRIVTVFNKSIGKCSGLVRGIKSSIQPGDISDVTWRGRTVDQLGIFKLENIFSPFGHIYKDASKIFAIDSACTMSANGLPDRAIHKNMFDSLKRFLLSVTQENWIADYIFFEISMLSDFGYGLNLTKCAVSGERNGLKYVSPRTGRAVTEDIAGKYKDRLFRLPDFLISECKNPTRYDVICAMSITGHFLKMYFQGVSGKDLPISRSCILEKIDLLDNIA